MNKTTNPIPYTERVKIVRDRLNRARRFMRPEKPTKPAKVLAAEKVVNEWEAKCDAAEDAAHEKHKIKVREIENALLLGDAEKVVKLLSAIGA